MLNVLTILSGLCTFAGMSAAIMDCNSTAPMPTKAPTEITVIKGNDQPSALDRVGAAIIVTVPDALVTGDQRAWALRTRLRTVYFEHYGQ